MYRENIEKMFKEEIREKRKTGSGSFHRRGKGVKHGISGALRTPSYYLSTKEKNKLNGEVESYNMFTTIIPYEEFNLKDKDTQRNLLIKWREIFENSKITEDMKISNKIYFDLIKDLDIPKKPRGGARNATKSSTKKVVSKTKKPQTTQIEAKLDKPSLLDLTMEPQKELQVEVLEKPKNKMTLTYDDSFTVEELQKIFTTCQLVTDGEEGKYSLSLTLVKL